MQSLDESARSPASEAATLLIGSSRRMVDVRERIANLAGLNRPVRIEGATGTGKSLAALLLHRLSPRRGGPFIRVALNALAATVVEDHLFGHARGAFTDAHRDRAGAFEEGHGGTVLLDEIGAAPPETQRTLLQVIETHEFSRVGETRLRRVDVRVVSATNMSLESEVAAGRLRDDLYYRLGSLLRMPSLSERREDVPELASHLLKRVVADAGRRVRPLTAAELAVLCAHPWPGNVRQLESALRDFVIDGRLPHWVYDGGPSSWRARVDDALTRHRGNKSAAARDLGISRPTLYREFRSRKAR